MMRSTVAKLITQMEGAEVDAIIISKPENRRYYSGFTGSSGMLLIHPLVQYMITDFRYVEQCKRQCPDYKIVNASGQKALEFIQRVCKELGIHTLWFEEEYVTYENYQKIKENTCDVELVPAKGIASKNRMVKTQEEIESIRQAAAIADAAFSHMLEYIKPGMTEKEVALELEFYMRRLGCEALSFSTIIGSGANGALPHAYPTDKPLEAGDLVVMDFGCVYNGYCSDMTRTIGIGKIENELKEIYEIVLEAQQKALNGIKAGMTGIEVDRLSREVIESKGYGEYFGHGLGHGVGLEIHEGPTLSQKGEQVLEPNMVVTVEPGIYLPGKGGVRIEDLVVVKEDGIVNLTASPKELYII